MLSLFLLEDTMGYKIINKISSKYVPKWGNTHEYIAIHYLGVDGQNYELASDGTGAHFTIYWDGTIYQRCSYDAIVWAVGTGGVYEQKHPYARNANTISIEMCCHCDGNKQSAEDPYWFFTQETQEACVWLVRKLMAELNIPARNVLRHFDIVNKTCPAPYVHNNCYKGSWTWSQFLGRIGGTIYDNLYRVRASWNDEKSQTGAYEVLDRAIADANAHPGYSVYDATGKAVYTSPDAVSGAAGIADASGVPNSKEQFIAEVANIAVELYPQNRILPSVVVAQCCLETGYGMGTDSIELVKRNNLLGMKVDLINNTWKSVWDGREFTKVTPEYYNGQLTYITDHFRVYKDYRNCIEDYEAFLLGVRNNKGYKYSRIRGITDPATVIHTIRIGTGTSEHPEGYCTDPNYETKVLNIIKANDLTKYDKIAEEHKEDPVEMKWYRAAKDYKDGQYIEQVGAYAIAENAIIAAKAAKVKAFDLDGKQIYPEVPQAVLDLYVVRRRWSEEKYQIGAFRELKNAKKLAKATWGYRVYDLENPKKAVYTPKLTRAQKLCAAYVRLNQWLVDDIADGVDWRYYNSKYVSESTFWKTRKAHKYYTNCMGGVSFAMKESGLPASACSWYGQKGGGIRWLNSHAQADLEKYADLIKVGNKTPAQLEKEGKLCPGDILTFVALNHTCGYLGNGLSFDSGHAYCNRQGEGAPFVKWVGPLSWANYKVGYIIRMR